MQNREVMLEAARKISDGMNLLYDMDASREEFMKNMNTIINRTRFVNTNGESFMGSYGECRLVRIETKEELQERLQGLVDALYPGNRVELIPVKKE